LNRERVESINDRNAYYEQEVARGLLDLIELELFDDMVWLRAAYANSKLAKRLDNNHGIDILIAKAEVALPLQVKVTEPQAVKFHYLYPNSCIPVLITRSRRWYGLHGQDPHEAIRKRTMRQIKLILATVNPDWWRSEYYRQYLQIEHACRARA
jgi:hypothetical protein